MRMAGLVVNHLFLYFLSSFMASVHLARRVGIAKSAALNSGMRVEALSRQFQCLWIGTVATIDPSYSALD